MQAFLAVVCGTRRGYPKVWPDNKKTSLTTYCQGSCMPMMGLEPIRCCHRQILSLVRLPFRHPRTERYLLYHSGWKLSIVFPRNLHEKMLNSSNSEEMGYSAVIRLSGIIIAQENRHSISEV